jgi:hypothetical protein
MHDHFPKFRDSFALDGKHEGKRQLGRPRRRWEENIKMDIREIVLEGVD